MFLFVRGKQLRLAGCGNRIHDFSCSQVRCNGPISLSLRASALALRSSYNDRFSKEGSRPFMSMEDVVIISGVRTAIGKFQGSLTDFSAPQLGAIAVKEAVARANVDPKAID